MRPSARQAATTVTGRDKKAAPAAEPFSVSRHGLLFLIFPAMLALTALEVTLSGRDLNESFMMLEREVQAMVQADRNPIVAWVQRGVSLLLLAACIERIASHLLHRKPVPSPVLTWTFAFYWLTTVAATAALAPNMRISHEFLYPLFLGLACTLSGPQDRIRIFATVRNSLLLFLLASVAMVPINQSLVLDSSYNQGLIPGLPRFGGLSSHPVMLGMLSQTAVVILWVLPFRRGWLNAGAWTLGLGCLFLAQSKTAWLAFVLAAACLMLVRRAPDALHHAGDPRRSSFGVGLCLFAIVAILSVLVGVLVLDLPTVISDFFNTSTGAQLASLTGRDRIWVIAMEEWKHHPVFGYGLTLWDADYRQAIAMPNATHAHNQFLDTMARSGTVGFIGLLLYSLVLTFMSFRYARATGGLSLALFTTIALLSISEVPLILTDYGSHVLTHFLLIVAVASGAASRVRSGRAEVSRIEPRLRPAT